MKKFCMATLAVTLVMALLSLPAFADFGSINFSQTEGKWVDAKTGNVIYMNGRGDFWAFPKSAEPYRGWVELNFDEGLLMYWMFDAKSFEFIDGFVFDTEMDSPEQAFHIGNDDEFIYKRVGEYDSYDKNFEMNSVPLVLMGMKYSGWEPSVTSNNYRGGYYYTDLADDDGLITVITNCCMKNDRNDGETEEEYLSRCAHIITSSEGLDDFEIDKNLTPEELKEAAESLFSELDGVTYPVHSLRFFTGANEDTTQWDMLIILTDEYTYAFSFAMAADFVEDSFDIWKDICLSERHLGKVD